MELMDKRNDDNETEKGPIKYEWDGKKDIDVLENTLLTMSLHSMQLVMNVRQYNFIRFTRNI